MITPQDLAAAEATMDSAGYQLWLCAWCNNWYDVNGYLPEQNIPADKISHGCCPSCAQREIETLKRSRSSRLPIPQTTHLGLIP